MLVFAFGGVKTLLLKLSFCLKTDLNTFKYLSIFK